jgi:DNA-binding MarR family transcriptional regulator
MNAFTHTLQDWSEISIRRSMHEFTRFMRGQGISMPQISVLMHLHHMGGCQINEIGKKLEISAPAASQLIQKLVEQGYLERSEDALDRRAKVVSITDTGRELIQQAVGTRAIWIESLAEHLTETEQATIQAALLMLIEATQREPVVAPEVSS